MVQRVFTTVIVVNLKKTMTLDEKTVEDLIICHRKFSIEKRSLLPNERGSVVAVSRPLPTLVDCSGVEGRTTTEYSSTSGCIGHQRNFLKENLKHEMEL